LRIFCCNCLLMGDVDHVLFDSLIAALFSSCLISSVLIFFLYVVFFFNLAIIIFLLG
jgi:hypothetical protein